MKQDMMKQTIKTFLALLALLVSSTGVWAQAKTAYAVLSDNTDGDGTKTLTFKYEVHTVSGANEWDVSNTGISQPWYSDGANITQVVFDPSFADARPQSCRSWFSGSNNLTTITGIEFLNTSQVIDMSSMFSDCSSLASLDVSHFNTSQVTTMENMFFGCSNLTSLDVSHFNTSQVTGMGGMFKNCNGLTTLDVGHFNTSKVTEMSYMFDGCNSLTSLDVSNFNTSKVESMNSMFYNCNSLTSLDVSHFDTSLVTDMGSMFCVCSNLTTLDVSHFDTSNVTSMFNIFYGCSNLTTLDVSHFNTSKVTNMGNMFRGCSGLMSLDVSSFNTSKVTNMGNMFSGCSSLASLTIGENFKVTGKTDTGGIFFRCTALKTGTLNVNTGTVPSIAQDDFLRVFTGGTLIAGTDLGGTVSGDNYIWKGGTFSTLSQKIAYAVLSGDGNNKTLTFKYGDFTPDNQTSWDVTNTGGASGFENPGWYSEERENITQVVFDPSFANARPKTCIYWFCGCKNLTAITGIEYLNTSQVTDMTMMFYFCSSLTSLDVSHFNTSKVTGMSTMFRDCTSLTSLDLSHFNTNQVKDMQDMFLGCSSLTSLDLSSFNTSLLPYTSGMFQDCSSLTSLDLSSFNTSQVITMENMFSGCSNLSSLTIGSGFTVNPSGDGFEAGKTKTTNMFEGCTNLANGTLRVRGAEPNILQDIFGTGTGIDNGVYISGTLISDVNLSSSSIWKGGTFTTKTRYTAYAVLSGNNDGVGTKTLTFKYGVHELGTNEWDASYTDYYPDWCSYHSDLNITQVVFDPSFVDARPKSCIQWFEGLEHLTTITGLEYLNTSQVTDMSEMFNGCISLTNLDLSHFNTSQVIYMIGMFQDCNLLTNITFGDNFNTSIVRYMLRMFWGCSGLTSLDVSHFNTSQVTDMNDMFRGCRGLTSLDVSHFNTSLVVNMASMFQGCSGLTSLDLSNFDICKVTWTQAMFDGCSNLTSLDLSSFNTSQVTDMSYMFQGCSNLTCLTIGSGFEVKNNTATGSMFSGCTNLADGTLVVKGTSAPSIAQDIFGTGTGISTGVFTDGTLITDMSASELDISSNTWKGGTFNKLQAKINVSYIDNNGALADNDAAPITEFTTSLGDGWYYVEGDVTIDGLLSLTGDANIILEDDAKLTVNNSMRGIQGNYDLAIYGQTTGNGKLVVHATDEAIKCHSLTVYGGEVEVGCSYGIYSATDVVIDGGVVTAEGLDGDGIYAEGNVTINGGQVTATGSAGYDGIRAGGDITLSYTTVDDFIEVSSYHGTVKTAADKPFNIAGGGTLAGGIPLDASQKTAIAGKRLTPVIKVRIGTDNYLTLQAALDAVAGDETITILTDITNEGNSTSNVGDKSIIIDLNGKTVAYGEIATSRDLTVKDGTLAIGKIGNSSTGNLFTLTFNNATVNINGVASGPGYDALEWYANNLTLENGSHVTVSKHLCLGGNDGPTVTIEDKVSSLTLVNCTISGYNEAKVRTAFLPYVEPGHESELIVDGATTNSLTFKKDWGLILVSDLTNATVTFYKAADIATFNTESPGTVATWANAPDYVVMHIVPDAGYWTNQDLLFAMETGATLAPSMRAPGLDLGQVPTLLKADEGYGNGAGWYYYQIPAAHTTDSYKTSTVDGFVVPTFDLSNATYSATEPSTDPSTVTVTATGGWQTVITIDKTTFEYNGTVQGPAISGTTMQVKKGSTDVCTLNISGNVSLSGNSLPDVGNYSATLSADANGCFSNSKTVDFNIYRTLALFSGSNTWATYVAQEDLALPAGLTAYIVTGVNGNTMATTALTYIPKDVAILLQRTDNTNNSYKAYAGTGTDDVSDNKLLGSATAATAIQTHKDYVLYNDRFELAGVSSVGAGKAYLPATALSGTAAPGFLYIEDYNTGVKEGVKMGVKMDDSWYTLDGRKLDKKPTMKGVYVRNGVKVVVK